MTYKEYKLVERKFNKLNNKLHSLSAKLTEEKNKEIRKICEKYNKLQKELSSKINNLGYNDLSNKMADYEEVITQRACEYMKLKYDISNHYGYKIGTKYITYGYPRVRIPKEHILDEEQYNLMMQELKVEKL